MKVVNSWESLRPYGIVALTGEACSLSLRILCDVTDRGKRTVERCFGFQIISEPWNRGSDDDPHVASVMLTRDMIIPLGIFALLDAGCTESWLCENSVIGIERSDGEKEVELMKQFHKPMRRFAYKGPDKDRNQHQMSGRVV